MRHSVLPLFGALALSLTGAALLGAQQLSQAAPPASHSDVSVAFRFGTPGFGLEVGKLLTGHIAARVGVNYYKISTTKSQSDISYAASLKLHALAVLIDLYPGQRGGFHFTGGIVTNPLTITATGQPSSGSYTINGSTYSSSQVGILTAQGKFPGASPYLGWGFRHAGEQREGDQVPVRPGCGDREADDLADRYRGRKRPDSSGRSASPSEQDPRRRRQVLEGVPGVGVRAGVSLLSRGGGR